MHTCCVCPGFTDMKFLRDKTDGVALNGGSTPEFIVHIVSAGRLLLPAEVALTVSFCTSNEQRECPWQCYSRPLGSEAQKQAWNASHSAPIAWQLCAYLQVPSLSKRTIVRALLHRISFDAFGAATLHLTLTRHWNCNGCNGRSVLLLLMSTRCTFRSIKRAKNALNCYHQHKDWHRPTVACMSLTLSQHE